MANLLWFHAYERIDPVTAVLAVRDGLAPPPTETKTKQLELQLGMEASHVYCYLGRTRNAFGEYAIAFKDIPDPQATVSPFDSGGLVKYCRPVCDWPESDRTTFLAEYSWPQSQIPELLHEYPGVARQNILNYLDTNERPAFDGPHQVWPDKAEATIWRDSDNWCAWTWEVRVPDLLHPSDLVAWTCPQAHYQALLDWAIDEADDADALWFSTVVDHYVEGGVGSLVHHLSQQQVPQ